MTKVNYAKFLFLQVYVPLAHLQKWSRYIASSTKACCFYGWNRWLWGGERINHWCRTWWIVFFDCSRHCLKTLSFIVRERKKWWRNVQEKMSDSLPVCSWKKLVLLMVFSQVFSMKKTGFFHGWFQWFQVFSKWLKWRNLEFS